MSLFFRVAPRGVPRGVRNWKQACPIFSELPAWSSAWSSPQSSGDNRIEGGNPGVTLKEAILGPRSHWQKKSVLESSRGRTGFFFPADLGAGSAGLRCRAGGAAHVEAIRLRCRAGGAAGGFYAGQAARQELNTSGTCVEVPWNWQPLSLEGVSQMVYILPERLPALVRPAFDLVLRRIRSLKRCAQA